MLQPYAHHFEILGITPTTSLPIIRKAYKVAVLRSHPDKTRDTSTTATFRAVQEAWEVLNQLVESSSEQSSSKVTTSNSFETDKHGYNQAGGQRDNEYARHEYRDTQDNLDDSSEDDAQAKNKKHSSTKPEQPSSYRAGSDRNPNLRSQPGSYAFTAANAHTPAYDSFDRRNFKNSKNNGEHGDFGYSRTPGAWKDEEMFGGAGDDYGEDWCEEEDVFDDFGDEYGGDDENDDEGEYWQGEADDEGQDGRDEWY